jgi:hypothetical protein
VIPSILPFTGTHILSGSFGGSGTVTLTIYGMLPDIAGTITPGGAPVTSTVLSPGQQNALTFTGGVGQDFALLMSGNSLAAAAVR